MEVGVMEPPSVYQPLGSQDLDRQVVLRPGIMPNVMVSIRRVREDPKWRGGRVRDTVYRHEFPGILGDLLEVEMDDLYRYVYDMDAMECVDACLSLAKRLEAGECMTLREVLGWLLILQAGGPAR
jgi:hypothetical protein